MTGLNDQQLMLLEMLTYMNENYDDYSDTKNGGIESLKPGMTVGDLIGSFSEESLVRMEQIDEIDYQTSGSEMAAIIRRIKNDPELMGLKMVKANYDDGIYCFEDTAGNAIVAFRGTYGGYEWKDNFLGLGTADTEAQEKALRFVDSLEKYDDITVVGHSKGGNKSMYCAILSDKVGRCVSLDGQGFSREFLEKYAAEIEKNAYKITSISLDKDFVHILLNTLPGITEIHVRSEDHITGPKCHTPAALFRYTINENGETELLLSDEAHGLFTGPQNEGMAYLHNFTVFVVNVCPVDRLRILGEYLGTLAAHLLGEEPLPDGMTVEQYLFSRPNDLAEIFALLMRYIETYNLSPEAAMSLLAAFGLDEIVIGVQKAIIAAGPKALGVELTAVEILKLLYANITDGERDPVLEHILAIADPWFREKFGIKLTNFLGSIEEQYTAIGHVNAATMRPDSINSVTKIFDYSDETFRKLEETMEKINGATIGGVHDWQSIYGSEEWYNSLLISQFVAGIVGYAQGLEGINMDCLNQAGKIFEKVREADRTQAQRLRDVNERLENTNAAIRKTAEKIRV